MYESGSINGDGPDGQTDEPKLDRVGYGKDGRSSGGRKLVVVIEFNEIPRADMKRAIDVNRCDVPEKDTVRVNEPEVGAGDGGYQSAEDMGHIGSRNSGDNVVDAAGAGKGCG